MAKAAGAPNGQDDRVGPGRTESWKAEYELTAQTAFTFYDWRHKILVRYAVVTAALVVAIRYVYEQNFDPMVRMVPFAVGALFSVYFMLTDNVHKEILDDCYRNGVRLEHEIRHPGSPHQSLESTTEDGTPCGTDGIFHRMQARVANPKKRWRSYRLLLRILFAAGFLSFAGSGIAMFTLDPQYLPPK